jgi:4-hydroxybenzoate polyprenyltransferase
VSDAAPRSRVADALQFIRFSHTIFALPFALGSMLVAAGGAPSLRTVGLILLAMVLARTAAMIFNRLADWEIDQRNPRTAARHRLMSKSAATTVLIFSAAGFIATTWFINLLCFLLSPVALAIVFFYSLTKRFTHAAQFFLGLALSVSPMGAWFAVTGRWSWIPCLLALAVLVWVAGFDTIYATQDHEIDRKEGLYSLVVGLGVPKALRLAKALHLTAFAALGAFGWAAQLRWPYWIGLFPIAAALIFEHRSASRLDTAGINRAFFLSNAVVGAVFVAAIAFDVFTR